MDIDRFNFWQTLPAVLEAISLSDYVAFDLEMTGISGGRGDKSSEHPESTAYRLAAEAARMFQILQVGLACLSYDWRSQGITAEWMPSSCKDVALEQDTVREPSRSI
jgi:poly(A)-specific ribonuclease